METITNWVYLNSQFHLKFWKYLKEIICIQAIEYPNNKNTIKNKMEHDTKNYFGKPSKTPRETEWAKIYAVLQISNKIDHWIQIYNI